MDVLQQVFVGFGVAFQLDNALFCLLGVTIGTLVGVLPGVGPVGAMGLLLPATMYVSPTASIIMLAGIYYGAQYGGTITSILVRIPGEGTTIVSCIDGHEMARQGRAGPALGIAAWGSFIAGTLSVLGLMLISNPLAKLALTFGPAEYFAVICVGLLLVTQLSHGSALKALMMAALGLWLGTIGRDLVSGLPRFTFGIGELKDGLHIVPLAMGLFAFAEVLDNIVKGETGAKISDTRVGSLWPSLADWAQAKFAILRGTLVGFMIGVLPGGGGVLATFVSYALEKKVSRSPERFGKGAIEGLAAPESANNSAATAGMVPLLSLGLPAGPIMAILFAALVIQGIQPGPTFINTHPDIFWGLIASMYLGNLMLLVLNLPLIGIWIQILKTPSWLLYQIILLFCMIGAYTVGNSVFDVLVMLVFGLIGYTMRKFRYDPAPLVLAFVLGPMLEENLRQALLISGGSFSIFYGRPIPATLLAVVLAVLVLNLMPFFSRYRKDAEAVAD